MPNPNPYNDKKYIAASNKLFDAIRELWESGASLENIEDDIELAFDAAEVER